MLNIDRKKLLNLDPDFIKKQRTLMLIVAFLLLLGGIFCLVNPFASGAALSTLIGFLFILSGVALISGMVINRSHNFLPMLGAILLGIAYFILGYVFITDPVAGMVTMSMMLAVLFAFGGILRLSAGFKLGGKNGSWLQIVIGALDLIIAIMLATAGPEMSITLVTTVVGIELLFSSFAIFQVASLFRVNR